MPSYYDLSVGFYIPMLERSLQALKKGEQWADENQIPHSQVVQARLADDMKPLAFQVQSLSDTAKACLPRLGGGQPAPSMEDNETTFAQLYDRIARTIDILKAADPTKFEGADGDEVIVEGLGMRFPFTRLTYMRAVGYPNFYFHAGMLYANLRKLGVPVGKADFLGAIPKPL